MLSHPYQCLLEVIGSQHYFPIIRLLCAKPGVYILLIRYALISLDVSEYFCNILSVYGGHFSVLFATLKLTVNCYCVTATLMPLLFYSSSFDGCLN